MSERGIKIFKLNFDGSFDEISYDNVKDVFTIVNILAIYISQKKTMYIWIGRNATQTLKNHISNIRVLLKEEFPDFRIIRNFTFEMRDEPFDFFKNLNITKEELYEIIEYQEKVMLPTLKKIDNFKIKLESLVDSEEYANAIKIAEEIIVLASKIEDDAVLTEQKRIIIELKSKNEEKKKIDEISEKTSAIDKEFSELIEAKEFLKAHQLVEEFEKTFSAIYDLSLIPIAGDLLSREKKIWNKEQERLVKALNKLENDIFIALNKLEIETALNLIERGENLFKSLVNDDIKLKWKGFETDVQVAKQKVELITKCDDFMKNYAKLKDEFQFNDIKTELNKLLKKVQDLKISDYKKKLENINKEIISAERLYIKKLEEIAKLEKLIESNQEKNLLEDLLKNCNNIIEIVKSINKLDLEEKYSTILIQTEKAIEDKRIFEEKQENLKKELNQLEKEIHTFLKHMEIEKARDIIVKSKIFLVELVDNKVKENWNNLEEIFNLSKYLIQNVESLSKKGIVALESKSYKDSFDNYNQIINLIKRYKKQVKGKVG
ncbi:MAG: hypothetical protein ACFFA0_08375 [Promethearchaeota archaeon]